MVKVPQQLHLAQCAQAEHGVVERGNLFDRDLLAGRLVNGGAAPVFSIEAFLLGWTCLPDDTVSTFTDDILDLVLVGHVEGDLPRSSLRRILLAHLGGAGLRGRVSSKHP